MTQPVPLVDLGIQRDRVEDAVRKGFDEVMRNTSFVLGPAVTRFEDEYARYCEVAHCVGVANGTDAVELALRAAGITAGDEVILPANTFIATAEAVVRAGAEVVLVDCTADALIDPVKVAQAVTDRTRAVVGVDLYGQMAPYEALREVVGESVTVVGDGAQSQGARQNGRRAGSVADVTATSFYPGKNLGAYGDGGAVLTAHDEIAAHLRILRNHGEAAKYQHVALGFNSRLDSLQAVVLSAKLAWLDDWNAERRAAAAVYTELLAGSPVTTPRVTDGNEHIFHLYVVQVAERDRVLPELHAHGVGAGVHYPNPIHLLPAFQYLGHRRGFFPVAEELASHILSLPLFPGITSTQQHHVVDALLDALGESPAVGEAVGERVG